MHKSINADNLFVLCAIYARFDNDLITQVWDLYYFTQPNFVQL